MPDSNGEYVTAVLYGLDTEIDAKAFLDLFVQIADRYKVKLAATDVCVEGAKNFRNPRFKKLSQDVERGTITRVANLTLYPSKALFRELGYSKAILSFSAQCNVDGWALVVAIDKSDILKRQFECPFADQVQELLVECNDATKARYGFCTTIPHGLNPIFFANSIQCGFETKEILTRNFRFFCARSAHLRDQIRDVFEFNVLSSDHLSRPVGTYTFRDWIIRRGHGSLREIQPDVWLWEVKIDQMPRYRRELDAAKVLIEPSPNEEVLSTLAAVADALMEGQDEE